MTGLAELASTLQLATGGGDFGILTNNPSLNLTSLYHMYVTGMTSMFDYGGKHIYNPVFEQGVNSSKITDQTSSRPPPTASCTSVALSTSQSTLSGNVTASMPLSHGLCSGTTQQSLVLGGMDYPSISCLTMTKPVGVR
jgi:hypothetical protein